jgi:HSP20 family protein
MYMMRWSPFKELTEVKERLERMIGEACSESSEQQGMLTKTAWIPAVDVKETEVEFVLYADLPGMTQEDINLQIKEEQLVLSGERKSLAEEKEKNFLRRERVLGPFYRAFTLSVPVEREKIKASYRNGVLEVILPKKEEVKPKQVKIEIN